MLRIGVWFDPRHSAYGGPTTVLLGTILGFYQHAQESGLEILILLNEPGDVNWSVDKGIDVQYNCLKAQNLWHGPACFAHADAEVESFAENNTWNFCRRALFPSEWYQTWICTGLPYNNPTVAEDRQHMIWPAGVDTEYFVPAAEETKKQDYFIYFKSQNNKTLLHVLKYLFDTYFGLRGTIITYYSYDHEILKTTAQGSKFCIMIDNTETQGLASLEIMSVGCPLFVLDATIYSGAKFGIQGSTSVTCWDPLCGLKSSLEKLETDFPEFIANLPAYNPRPFVCDNYSYKAAARRLLEILRLEN